VVVKARMGAGVGKGLRIATDRRQLERSYLEIESFAARVPTEDFSKPVIMEFIPGFVHDACAVAKDGEVVNLLTQVRHLMTPIKGGVGAVNITTDEPELRDLARTLLESLRWNGPAQVEFKYDPRDGQYKLIELNPRLWGTLDLSIRAGMNFPAQIRDLALGRPVRRNQPYRIGLRYVFVSRAFGAYIQLAGTHGIGALQDGRTYAATTLGFDPRDPIPGLWELGSTTARVAKGVLAFLRGRIRPAGPSEPVTAVASGLPKALVNTLDRSGDPGF
jgi:predicted ATP-grasp superfamily ATP-dependent carboligase